MLAIVAPGQGAQTPVSLSRGSKETNSLPGSNWLSAVVGSIWRIMEPRADAETIRDTAIAQPLLVAAGMVSALAIFPHPADRFGKVSAATGHSVGEITAAAGTRVLSADRQWSSSASVAKPWLKRRRPPRPA